MQAQISSLLSGRVHQMLLCSTPSSVQYGKSCGAHDVRDMPLAAAESSTAAHVCVSVRSTRSAEVRHLYRQHKDPRRCLRTQVVSAHTRPIPERSGQTRQADARATGQPRRVRTFARQTGSLVASAGSGQTRLPLWSVCAGQPQMVWRMHDVMLSHSSSICTLPHLGDGVLGRLGLRLDGWALVTETAFKCQEVGSARRGVGSRVQSSNVRCAARTRLSAVGSIPQHIIWQAAQLRQGLRAAILHECHHLMPAYGPVHNAAVRRVAAIARPCEAQCAG